jgi:hypothetical protein
MSKITPSSVFSEIVAEEELNDKSELQQNEAELQQNDEENIKLFNAAVEKTRAKKSSEEPSKYPDPYHYREPIDIIFKCHNSVEISKNLIEQIEQQGYEFSSYDYRSEYINAIFEINFANFYDANKIRKAIDIRDKEAFYQQFDEFNRILFNNAARELVKELKNGRGFKSVMFHPHEKHRLSKRFIKLAEEEYNFIQYKGEEGENLSVIWTLK